MLVDATAEAVHDLYNRCCADDGEPLVVAMRTAGRAVRPECVIDGDGPVAVREITGGMIVGRNADAVDEFWTLSRDAGRLLERDQYPVQVRAGDPCDPASLWCTFVWGRLLEYLWGLGDGDAIPLRIRDGYEVLDAYPASARCLAHDEGMVLEFRYELRQRYSREHGVCMRCSRVMPACWPPREPMGRWQPEPGGVLCLRPDDDLPGWWECKDCAEDDEDEDVTVRM